MSITAPNLPTLLLETFRPQDLTHDTILGGQVSFYQPRHGQRCGVDIVFLAASISAKPMDHVVELGTGTGVGLLCVHHRIPSLETTGIERDASLLELAKINAPTRHDSDFRWLCRDIRYVQASDLHRPADHILINPPFFQEKANSLPPHTLRYHARTESDTPLSDWLKCAERLLKHRGTVTLVLPTERLPDVLQEIHTKPTPIWGSVVVFPLWSSDQPHTPYLKRLLIRITKGGRGAMKIHKGMVLHAQDGRYTQDAENILRNCQGLVL